MNLRVNRRCRGVVWWRQFTTEGRILPVRLVHITDIQLGMSDVDWDVRVAYVTELVARVCGLGPELVIDTGDCVEGGTLDRDPEDVARWWQTYIEATAPLQEQCEVLAVPGNHDQDATDRSYSSFAAATGMPVDPFHQRRQIGRLDLYLLDLTMRVGDYDPVTGAGMSHHGAFAPRSEVHRWMSSAGKSARPGAAMVVGAHHPMFRSRHELCAADSSLLYNPISGNPGELFPMLDGLGTDLYLCGHTHSYERASRGQLTHVNTGANTGRLRGASDFAVVRDRDACITVLELADDSAEIVGRAIRLTGEVADEWAQPLRSGAG